MLIFSHLKKFRYYRPVIFSASQFCFICKKPFTVVEKKIFDGRLILYWIWNKKNEILLPAGNRPYECRVCGMKFLSKGMLNTHQANVHMGITRFVYINILLIIIINANKFLEILFADMPFWCVWVYIVSKFPTKCCQSLPYR